MTADAGRGVSDDPFDLSRFVSVQQPVYEQVLAELRGGQKRSHWMWFIFPQVDGLGFSARSRFYAIKSIEEARRYLAHPVLGPRLVQCAELLLAIEGRSASQVFGYPDDLKLRSCMTLFEHVAGAHSVFARVLDRYFRGEQDTRTIELLEKLKR